MITKDETPWDPSWVIARNHLKRERLAAGLADPAALAERAGIDAALYARLEAGDLLPTKEQFDRLQAALGDVPALRLYSIDMLQLMGAANYGTPLRAKNPKAPNAPGVMAWVKGAMELYVARDEVTWLEKRLVPDRPVEAFFSMSCGTQAMPHLLLDTVAVAKALGISFVAAAGPAGCCGKPYLGMGEAAAGEAFSLGKVRYAQAIGATTTVTWCHACQQNAVTAAARREIVNGVSHPVREQWVGIFLAERVGALGDRVPWKRRVSRRVLVDHHEDRSDFHRAAAREGSARLLSLIPGVEVVGEIDGELEAIKPCAEAGRTAKGNLGWAPSDAKSQSGEALATHLADLVSAPGADTVTSSHFSCHQRWGRYASHRLSVRHAVSILAEALGVAHPDRAQAAARLGNPLAVVKQTRAIWQSWGLSEERALELATSSIYPTTAGPIHCGCGEGDDLIEIDIVKGGAPGLIPVT